MKLSSFYLNQHGCCQIGSDLDLTEQTLIGSDKKK